MTTEALETVDETVTTGTGADTATEAAQATTETRAADETGKDPAATEATATDDEKAKDESKPDEFSWPDDWRERMAGNDEDLGKLAKRYGGPQGVLKALKAAQDTIRSGKVQKPMPDASDEKAMAEWRKEQGIPDDPSGYKLPDVVTKRITDDDKPMLASFTEYAHKKGANQQSVDLATEWYFDTIENIQSERVDADRQAAEAAEDALRKDWAHGEFKANMTLAKRAIEGIPGVGATWSEFRGPDGKRLGDNPEFIAWAADLGRNQFGDVAFASSDSERRHTARKDEIEKIRDTDFDRYEREGLDKEYRGIIEKELMRR